MKIVVVKAGRRNWTADYRLRVALANNNGGDWWLCLSRLSVAEFERRFNEGSVGRILYNVVGGLLGDHLRLKHSGTRHYLFVQLKTRDEFVDIALNDLGVKAMNRIAFEEITLY